MIAICAWNYEPERTQALSPRKDDRQGVISEMPHRQRHSTTVLGPMAGIVSSFRTLNILDEFSRNCLAIRVRHKPNPTDVIEALTDLFILRGQPAFVASELPVEGADGPRPMGEGPAFVAMDVRAWVITVGAKTAFIEPGSPWANGDVENFNARFRDKLLNGEISSSLREAKIVIEGLEEPLQHETPPKRPGTQAAGARGNHPDGTNADHASTLKPDLPDRAAKRSQFIS